MTHSVGRQSGAPFVSGPGATNNVTTNFTGGPWTYIRTHVDSSAETLATWRLDEDTSAKFDILNASATNAAFQTSLTGTATSTRTPIRLQGLITTDTGANPAMLFDVRTTGAAAVATRPLYEFDNAGTAVATCSAAGRWTFTATTSNSTPAALWTNGTINAGLFLGTAPDLQFGTTTGHNVTILVANAARISMPSAGGTTITGNAIATGVIVGGANTTANMRLGQKIATETSANYGGAALNTWSTTAGERSLLDFNRSKSATIGTQTAVASGDHLGSITFRGSDGTSFVDAAYILSTIDGAVGTNDMPGRITLHTTADGASSATERARITNAGDIGVGKTPTTGIILDVGGQLGLKSYTVATLPSASVQAGAIVYASDAGGNGPCLVISNGTNWKRCDNTGTTVT